MRQTMTISADRAKYKLTIETGLIFRLGEILRTSVGNRKILVATDDRVQEFYRAPLEAQMEQSGAPWRVCSLPPGENGKSIDRLTRLYDAMMDFQMSRDDVLLAFGGGVVLDIAGFAAATFLRGIKLLRLPTTLMAMVDSSIGGKNGANLAQGKNLIGTFYDPFEVLIDPRFVRTLSDRDLADGMAEVVKYGAVADSDLFYDLRSRIDKGDASGIESIIYRCCLIKKQLVEQDTSDQGVAMLLNFGHTLGHCIENYFPEGTFSHGQAVAIGMCRMAEAGERHGLTAAGSADRIRDLLAAYQLPTRLPKGTDLGELTRLVWHDRKRRGDELQLVLLERVGKGYLFRLGKSDFADFLGESEES